MTITILILAVLALLLGLLEVFVFPGFGFAGIGALVCAVVDVVMIYNEWGLGWAIAAVVVAVVVLLLFLRWMTRSRTLDRMALKTAIESTAATEAQLSVRPGDEGTALTRLALVGNAEIGGHVVEVKSTGELLSPGTRIRVKSVSEALIIVERCND